MCWTVCSAVLSAMSKRKGPLDSGKRDLDAFETFAAAFLSPSSVSPF